MSEHTNRSRTTEWTQKPRSRTNKWTQKTGHTYHQEGTSIWWRQKSFNIRSVDETALYMILTCFMLFTFSL